MQKIFKIGRDAKKWRHEKFLKGKKILYEKN